VGSKRLLPTVYVWILIHLGMVMWQPRSWSRSSRLKATSWRRTLSSSERLCKGTGFKPMLCPDTLFQVKSPWGHTHTHTHTHTSDTSIIAVTFEVNDQPRSLQTTSMHELTDISDSLVSWQWIHYSTAVSHDTNWQFIFRDVWILYIFYVSMRYLYCTFSAVEHVTSVFFRYVWTVRCWH